MKLNVSQEFTLIYTRTHFGKIIEVNARHIISKLNICNKF